MNLSEKKKETLIAIWFGMFVIWHCSAYTIFFIFEHYNRTDLANIGTISSELISLSGLALCSILSKEKDCEDD